VFYGAMAATASEMLPHVQLDPTPRVRWSRPDGCVEVGPDGTRWVYLAGTLLGCFTPDQPVERDILAAVLSGEKGIASGKLGPAFGVSAETIRVARARYEKGGFAALTDKRKRGAPTKQTSVDASRTSIVRAGNEAAGRVSRHQGEGQRAQRPGSVSQLAG
jgi:hypothetical protein